MTVSISIKLDDVSKTYFLKKNTLLVNFWQQKEKFMALNSINLTIKKGEKVAILGDNGAGKTTLLKLITGITAPTNGSVFCFGRVVSLIDITAGFQLDMSGRENIYLNATLLGMDIATIRQFEQKIIDFSGIGKFIDQAIYTYSSGMILRLGFSIAIHADPDILILDEGIIVGDQDFQKKAYDQIEEIFAKGKTVVVCSHMVALLKRLCNRFIWIDDGKIQMDGGKEVIIEYKKKKDLLQLEALPSNKNANLLFNFLKELPMGEKFVAKVISSSMEPLILKGDEVVVEKISFSKLNKGDIVAFWSEELKNILIHRFYKMEKGKIVTKGDSNIAADYGYVEKKNLLGIVTD